MAKTTKKSTAKAPEPTAVSDEKKAKTTKKKASKKKAIAKKVATKKKASASKKTTAKKTAAQKKSSAEKVYGSITQAERHQMIAEAAYLLSETQGFSSDEHQDWLAAEADVDKRLAKAKIKVID